MSLTARLVIQPLGRQARGGFRLALGTSRGRDIAIFGQRWAETNLVYVVGRRN
jgi:hypothetical protein